MTVTVVRHRMTGPGDDEFATRLFDGAIERIDWLDEAPHMMDIVLSSVRIAVLGRSLVDPRAESVESWYAVVNAMQVGSAVFRRAAVTEGSVECLINHKVRMLPAAGPLTYANVDTWLTAFFFAIVCRDQKRMTELSELPLDVLRASGAVHDEYLFHWVGALQAYWLRDQARMVDELSATFEKSHPSALRVAGREWVQRISYPPVNLFYRFVKRDHDGFHEALVEALELHKAYWTADEDREEDLDGVFSLGILAMACLAYDGGFPVGVESDYIPRHLVTRDWLGEFPT
ncbi:immunity 49 family protein [Streptomyces uncialis]|uniref:immunity 49 family protein n=1 Tax=Streptomyces uncialis TaxID=1048205 RepID=UPI002E2F1CA1|nr:immunity 49 family protein [Streptomyces uncialis]